MIVIGLTGSIGMGKSTAARMLETLGVPFHDADAEVHRLLRRDGKAFPAIAAAFPYFKYPQIYGRKWFSAHHYIKRDVLGALVFEDPQEREKLENILHPLVREAQKDFIQQQKLCGRKMVVLDIPLLFETGADKSVDYTMTVTAPYHVQKARVLSRSGMTEKKFQAILQRQMPDGDKQKRSDFVIKTGLGRAYMMKELKAVLRQIKKDQKPKEEKPARQKFKKVEEAA